MGQKRPGAPRGDSGQTLSGCHSPDQPRAGLEEATALPSLLGVDVGTTGVKSLLIDERGRALASAFCPCPLHTPRPNWAEQDPADWYNASLQSVREVLARAGPPASSRVAALSFSGQMHSAVFMDAAGEVVRPALLWCDTRTGEECRRLNEDVGPGTLQSLVGNIAFEGFTLPKILWLRGHESSLFARVRHVLLPKDYVRWRISGEMVTEPSDASGTLLFDVREGRWSSELMSHLKLSPGLFPPIVASAQRCGAVARDFARATGLAVGTPVVAGGADNACAALGTGVVASGQVMASIGTSGTVLAPTEQPRVDPGARVHTFCHALPSRWYLMGVVLSAGGCLRWYRDNLGALESAFASVVQADAYDLLAAQAAEAPPGAEGLLFLPYLLGERTPHRDAKARAGLIGLTARHTRAHVIRAVMEGAVHAMKDSLDVLEELGVECRDIRLTGGAARNTLWRRLQADVFGRTVRAAALEEGPALGAALLAGVGVGVYPDVPAAVESAVRLRQEMRPEAENAPLYRERHQLYKDLYVALKAAFDRAAAWDTES